MRKSILTVVAFTFVTMLNAQVFVGGSLGVDVKSNSSVLKTTDKSIETKGEAFTSLSVAPAVGYRFSERFAVGLQTSFLVGSNNKESSEAGLTNVGWGVSPFFRYYFYNYRNLSVYGQASFDYTSEQTKISKFLEETHNGPTNSVMGINIVPAAEYRLNDKIRVFANLNFFNIGYNRMVSQVKGDKNFEIENKNISNTFTFGAGTNLMNKNNLEIGFYVYL